MARVDDELEKFIAEVKKVVCLRETMKIYAPTCHGKCVDAVERLKEKVDKAIGGSTVYDAEGRWWDAKEKKLWVEPVKVIEAGHHCMDEKGAYDVVKAIKEYSAEADQKSLSFDQGSFYIAETEELQKAYEALQEKVKTIRELPEFI